MTAIRAAETALEGLPCGGILTPWVVRELQELRPEAAGAALFELFARRCRDEDVRRVDSRHHAGRGKMLHSLRSTYGGGDYRLIYCVAELADGRAADGSRMTGPDLAEAPLLRQYVALLAWGKGKDKAGPASWTAWERSVAWLSRNPEYRRA
jgi:hypothetical protein